MENLSFDRTCVGYASMNMVDIYKTTCRMKTEGRLVLPVTAAEDNRIKLPRVAIDLLPKSLFESTSVCIICMCPIANENHYLLEHSSGTESLVRNDGSEMDSGELLKCVYIGRAIASRLESAGSMNHFTGRKDKVARLKARIESMYGNKPEKTVDNPSKSTIKRNEASVNCNTYLDKLKPVRSFSRRFFVNMTSFKLNRRDQQKHVNYLCVYCSVWVTGMWSDHQRKRHRALSPLEDWTVRLHSIRYKVAMLHILFTEFDVFPRESAYGFEKKLQAVYYVLDDEQEEKPKGESYPTSSSSSSRRRPDRIPVRPAGHVIKRGRHFSVFGEPMSSEMHVYSYGKVKKLFGQHFRGFVNYVTDDPSKDSSEKRARYRSLNPSGYDCLNFLTIEDAETGVDHVALSHLSHKTGNVIVYDAGEDDRSAPLDAPYRKLLWIFHGHAYPRCQAGFSKQFCLQLDNWSCAYRSLFAAVGIIIGEDPAQFNLDLFSLFQFTKKLVEEKSSNLQKLDIKREFAKMASKKKKILKDVPKMIFLDDRITASQLPPKVSRN